MRKGNAFSTSPRLKIERVNVNSLMGLKEISTGRLSLDLLHDAELCGSIMCFLTQTQTLNIVVYGAKITQHSVK